MPNPQSFLLIYHAGRVEAGVGETAQLGESEEHLSGRAKIVQEDVGLVAGGPRVGAPRAQGVAEVLGFA